MNCRRYNPSVRVGNWNEELYLEEEKIKLFLKKRERGELLVQRARKLFCNLLKEVTLALPEEYLSFGSVVQLVAPDILAARPGTSGGRGVALAALVGEKEVDCIQHFVDGCMVVGTPLLTPCVHNAFIIRSESGTRDHDGEPLKFGQCFTLSPVETRTDTPLYVQSQIPQIDTALGASGHAALRLTEHNNTYCRWRVLYWEPALRPETEGAPFPPNCRVVINHAPSNKNLAVENANWFPTYFGMECEVSVHTYVDVHKRETAENLWMFVTQKTNSELLETVKLSQ